MSFEVFPKGCDRGTVSHLEGERVPNKRGIVTETVLKIVCLIFELCDQRWGCELTKVYGI